MFWATVLWLLLACRSDPPAHRIAAPPPDPPPPTWPMPGAPLSRLAPRLPPRIERVMIDPGHGAPGNDGNTGIRCQKEADEMLRIGGFVQDRLEHPGRLEVRSTRPGGAVTDYGERIRWADEWADLLISVHSDQRTGDSRFDDPVTGCSHSEGASGFAVLWSDEGSAPLVGERQRLADLVAARLSEAGFAAYPGADYTGLYEGDPDHPGVFVDRHPEDQRIRMLRRPTVPSIIIETHNAPDPEDVDRWQEAGTLEAFASALRTAIADYASGPD